MNGAHPRGRLALSGGIFYGTTEGGGLMGSGALYGIGSPDWRHRRIHDFSYRDRPWGGLTNSNLKECAITGATRWGGQFGAGSLFKLELIKDRFVWLYDFSNSKGELAIPITAPILIDSRHCLAIVSRGGHDGYGGIVKIELNLPSNSVDLLFSFKAAVDEAFITLCEDGKIYATVAYDPEKNLSGQLIRIGIQDVICEEVQSFPMPDAPQPSGPVICGNNGDIFGPAEGGIFKTGAIYSVSQDGKFSSFHHLDSSDGGSPVSLCIVDGIIYGNCYSGGAYGYGSVYRLSLCGNKFDVLYHFRGQDDGACPSTDMVIVEHKLLGATRYSNIVEGDFSRGGVAFQIDTRTSQFEVIHRF